MYLPPGSGCNKLLTVVHHLSDILMDDNHLSNSNDIIIVGDFNLPGILLVQHHIRPKCFVTLFSTTTYFNLLINRLTPRVTY